MENRNHTETAMRLLKMSVGAPRRWVIQKSGERVVTRGAEEEMETDKSSQSNTELDTRRSW